MYRITNRGVKTSSISVRNRTITQLKGQLSLITIETTILPGTSGRGIIIFGPLNDVFFQDDYGLESTQDLAYGLVGPYLINSSGDLALFGVMIATTSVTYARGKGLQTTYYVIETRR